MDGKADIRCFFIQVNLSSKEPADTPKKRVPNFFIPDGWIHNHSLSETRLEALFIEPPKVHTAVIGRARPKTDPECTQWASNGEVLKMGQQVLKEGQRWAALVAMVHTFNPRPRREDL